MPFSVICSSLKSCHTSMNFTIIGVLSSLGYCQNQSSFTVNWTSATLQWTHRDICVKERNIHVLKNMRNKYIENTTFKLSNKKIKMALMRNPSVAKTKMFRENISIIWPLLSRSLASPGDHQPSYYFLENRLISSPWMIAPHIAPYQWWDMKQCKYIVMSMAQCSISMTNALEILQSCT